MIDFTLGGIREYSRPFVDEVLYSWIYSLESKLLPGFVVGVCDHGIGCYNLRAWRKATPPSAFNQSSWLNNSQLIDLLPPPNAVALWRGIPTLSAVAHFS